MKPTRFLFPATLVLCIGTTLPTFAADGTWNSSSSASWNTAGDPPWVGSAIADGSGSTAFFNMLDLTADVTVTLGANRTIGNLIFADTNTTSAAGWTITGNTLNLAGTTPTITVGTLGTGKIVTINSTLTGTSGLTKEGAGQLTVSNSGNGSLVGPITVNGGLLIFNTTSDYTDAFGKSGAVTVNAGAELRVTGGINSIVRNTSDGAFFLNGGTFDYQGSTHGHMGNITLSNGATWKASAGGGYSGENMQLNGDVTVANTGGNTTASTMSNFSQGLGLNGNRTFSVADVTASSAADLIVSMELEDRDSGANGIIKTGAGTMRITTGATYSGATTVNGGTLLFDSGSTLRNGSGITVNTGATVELGATNIFTGGHGDAVNNSRVITVNGGTLLMNGNMDARFGNVTLQNGATWTSNRVLTNYDALLANTSTGAATIAVANTGGNTTASTMNGSGGIHLQGIQTFNVADVTASTATDLTVGMTLADPGSIGGAAGGINKTGAGTMSITRQASYSGGTTVTEGTLSLDTAGGGAGLLRGAVTVKTGATLRLNANDVTGYGTGSDRVSTINLESGSTMHISTTQNQTLGSCVINMTGAQITGIANSNLDFFAGASALNTLASDTASSTISGTKVNLRQSSVTFTVANGAVTNDLDISSEVYGNALVKDGAGTMRLSGPVNYNGTTTINGGTLTLHDSAGVTTYQGGQININNGSTLQITGSRYDFGAKTFNFGSSGGGSINTGTGVNWVAQGNWNVTTNGGAKNTIGGATGLNLNNGNGITFNIARGTDSTSDLDVVNGIGNTPGGLTKTGNGILKLAGTNTYTGATNINAGTLLVTGSLGNSTVNVANGATLVNNGTIAGPVATVGTATVSGTGTFTTTSTITISGTLSPGNSPGYQSYAGALTLANTASSLFELSGANRSTALLTGTGYYDAVDVGGLLTLDGTVTVTLLDAYAPTNGAVFNLFNAIGGINATGFNVATDLSLPALGGGLSWNTSTFTTNGTLTVVPETGAALLGSLGLLTLLRRRRVTT